MQGKHPELTFASVRCSTCGNAFTTRSTRSEIVVDVCSNCHPVYTGLERTPAHGSRIERFERIRALSGAGERIGEELV
ncbi:MAG: 50S ribosomal protein L31 [Actinomycetota bacterium]|nr:50S ribosomal protein L31 [Actinomycetota bacterium]MDQ3086319.1 50S ribosomal protein L31 [Actinomycetota bacterium]MDQ3425782.1 50S ribosomal protein L31 [Actinomycetota bacterium]